MCAQGRCVQTAALALQKSAQPKAGVSVLAMYPALS